MASSGKFDLSSSSSPNRPLYNSGKRGSHTASSMDRSSSFRENMENPILSSLPSMSRSSTINVSQGDVTNFFQCLRFDLKSMATEYKCNRHGDYKRLASAALCAPDGSPSGLLKGKFPSSSPEDLKRLRVGLRESTIKARERVKIFSEVLSVINKCFPSIPSRKRSRPDGFSGDRSNVLLTDRTAVSKLGAQSHVLASPFDFEEQKVEERGKNVVPNKRTRTSMVDQRGDVRPNTPARSTGSVDRDREIVRLPNSNSVDRVLPIVTDGWEKAKMKKKRTGIKADSTSLVSAKPIDGNRIHPRGLPDARSRLSDPHEFRPNATTQQASTGMRSSIPRPEQQEITSLLHDRRDQTTNLEQERTNIRPLNKVNNVRDDFISGTPSSSTKLHAGARGPRSGTGAIPKSSHVQRPTVSSGMESKNPNAVNRKRTLSSSSTRSSSPPVAQWADRRPQKISRTARRTNLLPVVPANDQFPVLGNGDNINITVSEKGRGFARRFPANSPKQFKSKGDHVQSSNLSESEESGATEIRSRDNRSKSEEVEEKSGSGPSFQKMSSLVPPMRKNKFTREDDLSPGVSRQGRTGRGFASARPVGSLGKAKQLRTGRVGFDKPESRVGRPPTRKLAGRKAYMRQKHPAVTAATDFLVTSDDGHEELLAAVKAVINPGCALSSPFWRQMDPLFSYVSDADLSYIKQEGNIESSFNTRNQVENCNTYGNNGTESSRECSDVLTSGSSPRGVSLCQTLLAALISEDEEDNNNVYGSEFDYNAINQHRSLQNFEFGGSYSSIDSTLRSCNQPDNHCNNGLLSDPAKITSSHYEYGNMSLDERLLIEINSLGLYPTPVPDLVHTGDGDVSKDIDRLEEKHNRQVSRKKSLLNKLIKATEEARDLHEKEFERLSLDKLTGMAYQKYMSCYGKGASGKMAKQAALNCVKRTLDRCHEFEATGKSCFDEPSFREMFVSGLSHLNDAHVIDGNSMDKFSGTQLSPSINNHEIYPSEQTTGNNDVWSSRVKKRELYLDDVACTSSGVMNSAKGKRSEPRNGSGPKPGRPASSDRKTKAKLKQKTTQLSSPTVNGEISEPQRAKPSLIPKPTVNENNEGILTENQEELFDLSHLQLPGMEDFGVGGDLGGDFGGEFGGQGEDIGSWLNIDDDVLQDDDFMGLEIPMDDLTDLNMMV